MTDPRPLWRDLSYWQGTVNFDILKADGAHGVFCRAGTGATYTDPTFATNYQKAGQAGMLRSSYFNLVPIHTVQAQIDRWYLAHPERDIVPRALDLEQDYGAPPAQIADRAWQMCEAVKARDGIYPIVYTRKGLVDPPENWLGSWTVTQKNALEWWLAQYHIDPAKEHPGPPTLPNGVLASKVILHQTNDTLPPPPGGAGSKSLDRDRWQLGDVVAMYSYINANWGAVAPPNPPAPIPPVQPLKTVKVTGVATYLNVRALPNGADLGELYKNTVVPVVQESGDWYRIDGWIHTGYVTDV